MARAISSRDRLHANPERVAIPRPTSRVSHSDPSHIETSAEPSVIVASMRRLPCRTSSASTERVSASSSSGSGTGAMTWSSWLGAVHDAVARAVTRAVARAVT